jgi:putative endonuclease
MQGGVLYILESQVTKKYYIGSTTDLARRMRDHARGNTRTTRIHTPWTLVYTETFETLREARAREKQLKKWKSHVRVRALIFVKN